VLGNIGVTSSIVFYESLLPHICREEEVDRVSSAGYAMGYVGGGLSMAVSVLAITRPDLLGISEGAATRLSFLFAAVWWAVFSIPSSAGCRAARLGAAGRRPGQGLLKIAVSRLGETMREMRSTSRRSCSWSPSSSTTTPSAPSSAWPRSTAPRWGST
jgi:UMF1 family MFS transporter